LCSGLVFKLFGCWFGDGFLVGRDQTVGRRKERVIIDWGRKFRRWTDMEVHSALNEACSRLGVELCRMQSTVD